MTWVAHETVPHPQAAPRPVAPRPGAGARAGHGRHGLSPCSRKAYPRPRQGDRCSGEETGSRREGLAMSATEDQAPDEDLVVIPLPLHEGGLTYAVARLVSEKGEPVAEAITAIPGTDFAPPGRIALS